MQRVSVTITPQLEYYVNDVKTPLNRLEITLRNELQRKEGVVVLHVDKTVPVEHLVRVASIATKLEAKVSIATRPELNTKLQ